MNKGEKLNHELRAVILVTHFFALWLGGMLGLELLILSELGIRFSGVSLTLIGASALANVVFNPVRETGVSRLDDSMLLPLPHVQAQRS